MITARLTPTIKTIVVILSTMFAFYLFVPASHRFLVRLVVGTHLFREPWQAVTGLFVHFSPLQFIFSGNRAPKLNRLWIEQMLLSANSTAGLQFVPEPADDDPMEAE